MNKAEHQIANSSKSRMLKQICHVAKSGAFTFGRRLKPQLHGLQLDGPHIYFSSASWIDVLLIVANAYHSHPLKNSSIMQNLGSRLPQSEINWLQHTPPPATIDKGWLVLREPKHDWFPLASLSKHITGVPHESFVVSLKSKHHRMPTSACLSIFSGRRGFLREAHLKCGQR